MSYICVYSGCNKNEIHVIDTISEKKLDGFIAKLGGNPKEELLEKSINASEEEHEKLVGTFMELECPSDVEYKIFKISNYDFEGKIIGCKCMENYGESVYCVKKGKYSEEEILGWVNAAQI